MLDYFHHPLPPNTVPINVRSRFFLFIKNEFSSSLATHCLISVKMEIHFSCSRTSYDRDCTYVFLRDSPPSPGMMSVRWLRAVTGSGALSCLIAFYATEGSLSLFLLVVIWVVSSLGVL